MASKLSIVDALKPDEGQSPKRKSRKPARESGIMPALVSRHDGFLYLGVGVTKGHDLINRGEIEAVRIGSRTLLKRASLDAFIARLERGSVLWRAVTSANSVALVAAWAVCLALGWHASRQSATPPAV